jgi:hypothetical protein
MPSLVINERMRNPVAHIHLEVFKTELQRLCDIGVLQKCGASKWASPIFIIPKKDESV